MPAEAKKSADPIPGAAAAAKPAAVKKPVTSSGGRAALAKVTLLDGSVLEVSIDVSCGYINPNENLNINLNNFTAQGKRERFN